MCVGLTLINIFAAVAVSELISCATAGLPLAAVRPHSVNTALTKTTAMRAQQTLVNVFTVFSIWFELVPKKAGTGIISHTTLSTVPSSSNLALLTWIWISLCALRRVAVSLW